MTERPDRGELDELVRRLFLDEELEAAEREALEASAEHRARVRELEAVVARLDAAGERENARLCAAADALEGWPGGEPARRAAQAELARLMDASARPERSWTAVAALVLAAAAAVVIVLWLARPGPEERPITAGPGVPDGLLVGDGQVLDASPSGPVEEYGVFHWRHDLAPDGWYEVRVWDAAAPAGAEPLITAEVDAPEWEPDEAQRARLTDAIRWEVRARSATRIEATVVVTASRVGR